MGAQVDNFLGASCACQVIVAREEAAHPPFCFVPASDFRSPIAMLQ
jgi:hypothetical protein